MTAWIAPRLFAEYFDGRFPGPEPGEIEFVLARIAEGGEPVLELGSGTGRVLLPLLERGLDVTGIDVSADMLDRCRRRAVLLGLEPMLLQGKMQTLELPRRYGTVFTASGGLSALDSVADLHATLEGAHRALRRGGVVSLEFLTPPESVTEGQWIETTVEAEDGSMLALRQRHRYDAARHVRTSSVVVERRVDDRVHETQRHETTMRFWTVEEISSPLRALGYEEIAVTRALGDEEAGEHSWLVVRARKPRAETRARD